MRRIQWMRSDCSIKGFTCVERKIKTVDDLIQRVRMLSRHYSDTSILMHEAIARNAGLSGTDHKYLGLLLEQGPMTAGDLSILTGLTTGAVTGLIDRLERKKLVKRKFSKEDRRKVFIEPNVVNTIKLLTPHFADLQKKSEKLINSFSEDEIKIIDAYFSQAIDIMKMATNKLNAKQ